MDRHTGSLLAALLSACAADSSARSAEPAQVPQKPREATAKVEHTIVELPPEGEADLSPVLSGGLAELAVDLMCEGPQGVDPDAWAGMTQAEREGAHAERAKCVDGVELRRCAEDAGELPTEAHVVDDASWSYVCEAAGLTDMDCTREGFIPPEVAVCIARVVAGPKSGPAQSVWIHAGRDAGLQWRVSFSASPDGMHSYERVTHLVDARTGEYTHRMVSRAIPGRPLAATTREASVQVGADSTELAFWMEMATGELLSVPAFARHIVELEAMGAPAIFVDAAAQAMTDEVRHFTMAWACVESLRGARVGVPAFDTGPALGQAIEPRAVLTELVRMGCINETLSAFEALQLAQHCEQPEMCRLWEEVARDEMQHATLAWDVLAWMLERWPELGGVARAIFDEMSVAGSLGAQEEDELLARGAAGPQIRARWAADALVSVVRPMAARVLG